MLSHFRFALRKIMQQPLYALLAISTLGIGIGAVATCFSAINTLLFRPLPAAADSDRLVVLHQTRANDLPGEAPKDMGFNYSDALFIAEHSQTLSALWLHTDLTVIVEGETAPHRFLGTKLTAAAFDELGIVPQLGRNLTAADMAAEAEPVALISDAAWEERFDRSPDALGVTLEINGEPTRIVGIMPPDWRYPEFSDVWLPMKFSVLGKDADVWTSRGYFMFSAHANLAPGTSIEEARAELSKLATELETQYPKTNDGVGISVKSWRSEVHEDALYFTVLLFAAGVTIFLIACANIANLQLSRGSDRGPEIAVRLALGASRRQIFRQLALENLLLGLLGAIAGAVFALWAIDWVLVSLNTEPPFWLSLTPDWRVLSFTALAGVMASFVFGLAPALRDSRPDIIAGLKESSRTGLDQGPYGQRLRNGIVIVEIALALVLLVGAGLMTRSFIKLRNVESGYNVENVLTFRVGFPIGYSESDSEEVDFFRHLPRRLERLDVVDHAGAVSQLPNSGMNMGPAALVPLTGDPQAFDQTLEDVAYRTTTAGYFAAMGIPLLAGRDIAEDDLQPGKGVAVVDTIFVRSMGLTPEEIIGRRFVANSGEKHTLSDDGAEIIGVVGAIRHFQNSPKDYPTLYYSHHQAPANFMSVVVKGRGSPEELRTSITNEVLALHPGMPIYDVLTGEQVLLQSIWQQYFFARLFMCAGLIAVVLACIGIYGVMTFAVTMRQHEIGLRMALGAPASEVVGDVVRKGLYLVVIGLGAGVLASTVLSNLLAGALYGITPHDPPTFVIVPVLLASVALLACYLSSRRATRIDPMAAMRAE